MTSREDQSFVRQGFKIGGNEADLFQGTALYYARYRRPYPTEVINYLVETFNLNGEGGLLDVGCGTGQVFLPLASYFQEIVAIDADTQMIAIARQAAIELAIDQVQLHQMRAEELSEDFGKFRLATFGASFHWMDRLRVANRVYDLLGDGGGIAVLAYTGIHEGKTEWEAIICKMLEKWLGPKRRAGGGIYQQGERHQTALAQTRFGSATVHDLNVDEVWTTDEIIGFLYSTSYASKGVLGDQAEEFEAELRERLSRLQHDGLFHKSVEYTVISSRK